MTGPFRFTPLFAAIIAAAVAAAAANAGCGNTIADRRYRPDPASADSPARPSHRGASGAAAETGIRKSPDPPTAPEPPQPARMPDSATTPPGPASPAAKPQADRNGRRTGILTRGEHRLTVKSGSNRADCDGVLVVLPAEVEVNAAGRPVLPPELQEAVAGPLLTGLTAAGPVRHLMLDPGHGGHDPGTRGKNSVEKQLNLAFAQELSAELRQRGYRVSLTRSRDEFVPLSRRPALAEQLNCDLFISLHHNYAAASDVRGAETYALAPSPGQSYRPENCALAWQLQKKLAAVAPGGDRGLRFARFKVLTLAAMPAALIELGFLSNADDEKAAMSADDRRSLVMAVAAGIDAYAGDFKPVRTASGGTESTAKSEAATAGSGPSATSRNGVPPSGTSAWKQSGANDGKKIPQSGISLK